jgi:hypothetical protein
MPLANAFDSGQIDLGSPVNRLHPLNRDLTGWFLVLPGKNGGGQWSDLTGRNPLTLTSMGTSTTGWRPTTRLGGAGHMLFNGSAGYCLGSGVALDYASWTVMFWVRPTTVSGSRYTVADFGTNVNSYPMIEIGTGSGAVGGRVAVIIPGFFICETADNAVAANVWTHVTYIHRGTGAFNEVYINGVQVATPTNTTDPLNNTAGAFLQVGRRQSNSQYFPGPVDDLRIMSRPISASEVLDTYNLSRLGYPGAINRIPAPDRFAVAGAITPFIAAFQEPTYPIFETVSVVSY